MEDMNRVLALLSVVGLLVGCRANRMETQTVSDGHYTFALPAAPYLASQSPPTIDMQPCGRAELEYQTRDAAHWKFKWYPDDRWAAVAVTRPGRPRFEVSILECPSVAEVEIHFGNDLVTNLVLELKGKPTREAETEERSEQRHAGDE
jgi:hypothetical protein